MEYMERTEELILAMNAGARAIENTKKYHGTLYSCGVFSDEHKEIPYLKAAGILREAGLLPAADVVPVVRCKDCKHYREYMGRDMCSKNAQVLDGREDGR